MRAEQRLAGSSEPREPRQMEQLQAGANSICDLANDILARVADMRGRLLGEIEAGAKTPSDGPRPVGSEIQELRRTLETAYQTLQTLSSAVSQLERI